MVLFFLSGTVTKRRGQMLKLAFLEWLIGQLQKVVDVTSICKDCTYLSLRFCWTFSLILRIIFCVGNKKFIQLKKKLFIAFGKGW